MSISASEFEAILKKRRVATAHAESYRGAATHFVLAGAQRRFLDDIRAMFTSPRMHSHVHKDGWCAGKHLEKAEAEGVRLPRLAFDELNLNSLFVACARGRDGSSLGHAVMDTWRDRPRDRHLVAEAESTVTLGAFRNAIDNIARDRQVELEQYSDFMEIRRFFKTEPGPEIIGSRQHLWIEPTDGALEVPDGEEFPLLRPSAEYTVDPAGVMHGSRAEVTRQFIKFNLIKDWRKVLDKAVTALLKNMARRMFKVAIGADATYHQSGQDYATYAAEFKNDLTGVDIASKSGWDAIIDAFPNLRNRWNDLPYSAAFNTFIGASQYGRRVSELLGAAGFTSPGAGGGGSNPLPAQGQIPNVIGGRWRNPLWYDYFGEWATEFLPGTFATAADAHKCVIIPAEGAFEYLESFPLDTFQMDPKSDQGYLRDVLVGVRFSEMGRAHVRAPWKVLRARP